MDCNSSDVVLEAKPWPPGASRPNSVALVLASKVQALRAALTFFGINLKLKQDNKLIINSCNNKLIIIYM